MTLEQQLGKLSDLGLHMNKGITVDDLLYSFPREEYEKEPFDVLLFMFGIEVEREPWGRRICDKVWNFDTECIVQTGDYVRIVKELCALTDEPSFLTNVQDYVNLEQGEAWLKYTINGREQTWSVEVNNDWADTLTLTYVMSDLEHDGKRFYALDNGQAMILFYLNAAQVAALNQLSETKLAVVTG
jgi:hypothetical protein